MVEKEASQRRIIEQQFTQIADLQKTIKKLKEGVMEGVRKKKSPHHDQLVSLILHLIEPLRG